MKSWNIKYRDGRKVVTAIVSAPTKAAAMNEAARRGQAIGAEPASSGGRWSKMTVQDRQIFFQRLSSMLASKVGTSEALEIMHASFNGIIRDAARMLLDQLKAGASLHDAMTEAGPRYFPESVVAIIQTGSRGGDIAYAIKEAARFERELSQVKKESSKGVYSALFGFVAGLVTILASTMYVAPMILQSSLVGAAEGGVDVGWIMTMAHVTTAIAVCIGVVVGTLFLISAVMRPFAPAAIDRFILKVPFYRDMVLAKSNYMVFFGLAVLLKAGLRVEEALQLTIDGAPRGELRNDLERARDAIKNGSVQPWPYKMTMLHPTDKAALATAQDRTQTASTIEELSKQYQALYRSRLETFVPALQLVSALFLSIAGFVLFGVSVLPLMESTSSIMKAL